jgi:hypothetical protein
MRSKEADNDPRRWLIAASALAAFAVPRAWSLSSQPSPAWAASTRITLRTRSARFIGDFDQILDRRYIRMIVPYSRTLFFRDKSTIYGIWDGKDKLSAVAPIVRHLLNMSILPTYWTTPYHHIAY